MGNQEQMLHDIGVVDFVLVDLMLYLDTHPYDCKAMEYFNHYSRIKNQMSREFSQKYYPLTKDMAESNKEWRWGMAPLPWEGGCR
ncbi:MAG: spore coat protein CotJB [Lachnospiraceae bacterium]|nr:spore coat protein CotJB [Lachnospiraceae bacterium]